MTPDNSEARRESVKDSIRQILAATDPSLELRSIRRGGLQQLMKLPGATMAGVLRYSQHKSTDMLRRYLDYGALATDEMDAMMDLSTSMVKALEDPEE